MKEMIYDESGIAVSARWAIGYEGFLFEGDSDYINVRDCDSLEEAMSIYNRYPEIQIFDWLEGAVFCNGEWKN